MRRIRAGALAAGVAVVLAGCQPPRTTDAVEAMRAADSTWLRAITDRDLEGVVAAVDPSGNILPPNAPIVTGQEGARGKFVTIWRRRADGSWKVVEDVFNSDLPAPGS